MNAAGAVPGRVGKCPRCGSMIRVPESFDPVFDRAVLGTSAAPPEKPRKPAGPEAPRLEYGVASDPAASASGANSRYYKSPTRLPRSKKSKPPFKFSSDVGPIAPPARLEVRFRDSLLYPLWSWHSVAILIFLPPIMVFAGAPLLGGLGALASSNRAVTPFGIILHGFGLGIFFVGGYCLLYFSEILVSSALGEILPPRPPTIDADLFRVALRWAWAGFMGLCVGGLPAVVYWIYCGRIGLADWFVFIDLIALGAAYAQMALLAALLHDDPLAVNPVTVIKGLRRVGWEFAYPCFLTSVYFFIVYLGIVRVESVGGGFARFVAYWEFWLLSLYGAMVVLRRLGLFCHKHAAALAWFRV